MIDWIIAITVTFSFADSTPPMALDRYLGDYRSIRVCEAGFQAAALTAAHDIRDRRIVPPQGALPYADIHLKCVLRAQV